MTKKYKTRSLVSYSSFDPNSISRGSSNPAVWSELPNFRTIQQGEYRVEYVKSIELWTLYSQGRMLHRDCWEIYEVTENEVSKRSTSLYGDPSAQTYLLEALALFLSDISFVLITNKLHDTSLSQLFSQSRVKSIIIATIRKTIVVLR